MQESEGPKIIINPIKLWGYLCDAVKMFYAVLRGRYPAPKYSILWAMLFALYFVLPLDFLPELFFTVFGFGDDLVFLIFVLNKIRADVDAYRLFKDKKGPAATIRKTKKVIK